MCVCVCAFVGIYFDIATLMHGYEQDKTTNVIL
jgi:hypothetical protein